MSTTEEHIKNILSVIPESPGCYQYFDEKGTIIYVGKAKNLKRRVSSYFNKEHDSNKTRVLVKQIRDIKYFVVDTEEDALLLENNLIKQYRPRYNVLLKDDKTYPSIVVKNEYFPRVFQTRNIVRDGSRYYGPYPSIYTAKVMLQMLKELYPLRTCKYPLTPESIAKGRYKVCLLYTSRTSWFTYDQSCVVIVISIPIAFKSSCNACATIMELLASRELKTNESFLPSLSTYPSPSVSDQPESARYCWQPLRHSHSFLYNTLRPRNRNSSSYSEPSNTKHHYNRCCIV